MTEKLLLPTTAQLDWLRTETNAFFHFGINTFTGREWGVGSESPSVFNPSQLDCRQWARAAKAGGFKVGILTAKHHDGFCLWPSRDTEHSVKSSPWKNGQGDVVREFVDAFRAEGLKVGLYLSPWDRHEPCYGDSPRYNDFYCRQMEELLTGYGELAEVWFDGACAEGANGRHQEYDWPRFFALVKELQPNAVTFGDGGTDVRWVGNERGIAGETCWGTVETDFIRFPGDSGISQANDAQADVGKQQRLEEGDAPDGSGPRLWRPAECDVSIRPGWFYHSEQDDKVRSADDLIDLYFHSVGRNSVLLLNLPITPEGLVHTIDAANVAEFYEAKQALFACDLATEASVTASSQAQACPVEALLEESSDSYWKAGDDSTTAELLLTLPQAQSCSILSLQEPIVFGQNIAEYSVEARDSSTGPWLPLCRGTTVGYKRLHRFVTTEFVQLRLQITQSYGVPALSSLRLF